MGEELNWCNYSMKYYSSVKKKMPPLDESPEVEWKKPVPKGYCVIPFM